MTSWRALSAEIIKSSIQLVSELLTDAFNQFITCLRQVHPNARYDEQVSHNAFQITSGSAALNCKQQGGFKKEIIS